MVFRTVALDASTELSSALDQALDPGEHVIQRFYRGQEAFSLKASSEPLSLPGTPTLELGPKTWW